MVQTESDRAAAKAGVSGMPPLPDRNDAVSSLVSHVDGFFRNLGLYASEYRIAPRHPYERSFAQYAHVDPRKEPNLCFTGQRLSHQEPALTESKTSTIQTTDGDL
jgi:hypothetical protein